ncbi:MAG: M48 family metallopeptidase [Calditrichaeota bacterium]|jgi:STE24 endopeptidase|nr:M48 family metallopeptidase [Calditrichota bacterium]
MVEWNGYLVFILAILIGNYILTLIVENLNIKRLSPALPDEFEGHYDAEKYSKSQNYTRVTTKFGNITGTFDLVLIIVFILIGGFNWLDNVARGFGFGEIVSGLIFAGLLIIGTQIVSIPFSIYSTFVIEEKFGFNRTTAKTFVLDLLKGLLISVILSALVLWLILWFFGEMGAYAWLYVWGAMIIFQVLMLYISPVLILPLFNKFTPLEDGELKKTIVNYMQKNRFKLKGLFTIDGSKRSSKANAYFTGFGKLKRVALYDTLIEKFEVREILTVLAHEVGHSKLKHIPKRIFSGILQMGLMLFLLSLFIKNEGLHAAFGMENVSIYASLIFFSFIYSPVSMVLGLISTISSRKHEYEADAFAGKTTGDPDSMIGALKKLSVTNLSNLTPHPLKVFLEYDHPPVLARIKAIRKLER